MSPDRLLRLCVCAHASRGVNMQSSAVDESKYPSVDEAKTLVAQLCAHFYSQGWVSGTGGGISVRAKGGRIVMAPSVRGRANHSITVSPPALLYSRLAFVRPRACKRSACTRTTCLC